MSDEKTPMLERLVVASGVFTAAMLTWLAYVAFEPWLVKTFGG